MDPETLLEERYAPDQFKVLITCIFLNKTPAVRAGPFLEVFLQDYPSAQSLQGVLVNDIKPYFQHLGLFRRAYWIKELADQLIIDPPVPKIMRQKSYRKAGYASEVAHLKGIGDYGSDAWRLFCKEHFYANCGIVIKDEWKRVRTRDKELQKYIDRRWREETLASQFSTLVISKNKEKQEGILIGNDPYATFVPKRIILTARDHGTNPKRSVKQQGI